MGRVAKQSSIFVLVAIIITLLGCSGGSDNSSPGSNNPNPGDGNNSGNTQPPPDAPTFFGSVGQILMDKCVSCHTDGGIAPFPLDNFADASQHSAAIKFAVQNRTMPPWGADNSGSCNTWKNARWLADNEIATIANWVDTGSFQGDPKLLSTPVVAPSLDRVDAKLDIGFDYLPQGIPAHPNDNYRCFIVDPVITQDMFLTAYEVIPDNDALVHHMLLFSLDTLEIENTVLDFEIAEGTPGEGYTCFGGIKVNLTADFSNPFDIKPPDARFLSGWAPGFPVTNYPAGTGIKVLAGRKMVMQIHYNLENINNPDVLKSDRTIVNLKLEKSIAKEAYVTATGVFNLNVKAGQISVAADFSTPQFVINTAFAVPDSANTLYGVFPHMHTLGKTIKVDRNVLGPDNDGCIVDVPNWDFEWQEFFFLEQPIELNPLDSIKITCSYDTTSRTEPVIWGEETDQEMCLNFFYVTK